MAYKYVFSDAFHLAVLELPEGSGSMNQPK